MEPGYLAGSPDQVDYRNDPSNGATVPATLKVGTYDAPIDQGSDTVLPMTDQSWMFSDQDDVDVIRDKGINSPAQQADLFNAPDFVAEGTSPDLPRMVAWERYGASTPPKEVRPW